MGVHGLVAAVHTPFDDDGAVNLGVVGDQASLLHDNGVSHVLVAGTTGEGLLLSTEERKELAREWARSGGPLGVMIHVGHVSLVEARGLAAHAASVEAAGIAAMAPPFFRPSGLTQLVAWCAEVAAAAPDTPFFYYHIPSMNMDADMMEFVDRARERIPTFAGIKYTHSDMMEAARLLHVHGHDLDILAGRDEFHLPFLALGAEGAVGSTYNYAAPHYLRMRAAWAAGDQAEARRLNALTAQLVDLLRRAPEIAVGKCFVRHLGVPVGGTRLPLRQLTDEEERELLADVEALGVLGAARS